MGYVERSLLEGEVIIYRAKISWAAFFRLIFPIIIMIWLSSTISDFFVLLTVVFVIFMIIRILLAIITTEFALTDRRIIAKRGIIQRHSMEILLSKVESIAISQPLDGRIFGFGTVTVIGSGGTKEFFKSISNPLELKKQINNQISRLSKKVSD